MFNFDEETIIRYQMLDDLDMERPSLYDLSLDTLLCSSRHLSPILINIHLPVQIHKDLFVRAVRIFPKHGDKLLPSIAALVATWPETNLRLCHLFPAKQISSLLHHGRIWTLLDMIMSGLLNQHEKSKLMQLDLTGTTSRGIFQLPLLSLPLEQRQSTSLMETIINKCRWFAKEDADNMASVLSWKIAELSRKCPTSNYHGNVPLNVLVDYKLSLSEWMAMVDEMIGLCTMDLSPFRFKVQKLSVDNYYRKHATRLKWFLTSIDKRDLLELNIFGHTQSMRLFMWDLYEEFSNFCDLLSFGLGTTGPRFESQLVSPYEPSNDDVMERCVWVLQKWEKLEVLQIVGMVMTTRLRDWLSALMKPLKKLSFYACKLALEDVTSLAQSHHLSSLVQLGLEKNNLRGCAEAICSIVDGTPNLKLLNLRETDLAFHEKITIVSRLCGNDKLETLALYEKEDMLSTCGYAEIVTLACAIRGLKNFYIFPFNYRPFEMFYRETVQEECVAILRLNERTDLQLYY